MRTLYYRYYYCPYHAEKDTGSESELKELAQGPTVHRQKIFLLLTIFFFHCSPSLPV